MGKSETAFEVAKFFNAEIVNGDAFQIYKQLEIGVAKPPKKFLDEIPHHLFSFIDVDKDYSIADYQIDLRRTVDDIISRGKNVVIVGGSGLYIKSALYDYKFAEQPKVDLSKYENLTNEELFDELNKIDPKQAEKIHLNNRKRILRAIEIYLAEGKTKSEIIESQEHKLVYDARFFVRDLDRQVLYEAINKRVDLMVKEGLINEVKGLIKNYSPELKSLQAIGYKEIISALTNNQNVDEAIETVKKNSRNYAKRQVTFIKHQFPVEFYKNTQDLLEILKNE